MPSWTAADVEAALARLWELGLIEPTPPATGLGPDTIWRYSELGRRLNELLAEPPDPSGEVDAETLAVIRELADNEAEALTLGRVARLARQTYLVTGSDPPRKRWEHPGADPSLFAGWDPRRPW